METGQEILCDTNVWYDIVSGRLQAPPATLCHARTIMYELLQVKSTMTDSSRHQNICRAFIDHRRDGYHLQPIAHMADVLGFDMPKEMVLKSLFEYDQTIERIERIASGPLNTEETEELKMLVQILQEPTWHFYKFFAQIVVEFKKKGSHVDGEAHLQETKIIITNWMSAKVAAAISPEKLNWDQVELFLLVFDLWLKVLMLTDLKPKFNDLVDVFNLAYVQPGTLYWTSDKYWKKLIKSVGLQDYLYTP